MQKKTTSNLEKNLKSYNSLERYFSENETELTAETLESMLQAMIAEKGMTRAEVVKESNLNEVYAYQIISGVRRPSRDKLLCLCFAMKATLAETQTLLKHNGFAPLYARNRRDSIIIFDMEHGKSVLELNDDLFDHGEAVLQ